MLHRASSVILLACCSITLLNTDIINCVYADQNNTDELQQPSPGKIYGKVTDVIEAAGYTYAEVETGKGKVWAAGPATPLTIGDVISFTTEMPKKNFHSSSMNRDFPIVYFVNQFITDGASPKDTTTAMVSAHSTIQSAAEAKPIEGIEKIEGGNTIAELYADRQKLNGKSVRVRGQVTKFTANIMHKNWLHIRDSSTLDDLTVTTNSTAAIDSMVVIEGKLALDKNLGYGFVYPIIVEDAKVTME